MKTNMKNSVGLATVVFILLAGVLIVFYSGDVKSQVLDSSAGRLPGPTPTNAIPDSNFPVVSLQIKENSKGVNEKRWSKNARYDNWGWVARTVGGEERQSAYINHWQFGISALPVQKSDAVVVGTVGAARAYLSNDETGVYSEFTVKVDQVVKDNSDIPVIVGSDLSVDRAGGRVLYPSGQVLRYSVYGQAMPRIGGRYVLFLRYDKNGEAYTILTGYELLDGKVTPLDGRGQNKGSGFDAFQSYNGIEEFRFFYDLNLALHSPTNEPTRKVFP